MSAQFGRWNHDCQPLDAGYLRRAAALISPYGPDGEGSHIKQNVAIVYRAFNTTGESRHESQPYTSASGAVITCDGRLDNRAELIGALGELLTANSTDLEIVAAAYDTWGTNCFSRLIGDWALSIWNPGERSVILAKDPIGTRPLYYACDRDWATWSTILDPLVLLAGKTFQLNEEYVAGWLSFFPAAHLTPYNGIHSVPPSSLVVLRPGSCSVKRYWDFDPGKRIQYATDGEYEEHFREVFRLAVRRRLRSDRPILAELSGGMDSSSIVCMADEIIARAQGETPRLDTVSFYDDTEPNWNEQPYFTRVEEKRGRAGWQIDISNQNPFDYADTEQFAATPESGGRPSRPLREYSKCLTSNGNRVVLSGIGGDEVMGGVPTPNPELEDLIARLRLGTLARQLKLWALHKRKPWFHLFFAAARGFFPASLVGVPKQRRPAPWLNSAFVKRNRAALLGYEERLELFGPLPSFQENLGTLDAVRRQLACADVSSKPPYQKSYPYLDRSLLEFLYAVPREQLVRPGQRRSLMRRALAGIVPDEVLNRRRKAYVARAPLAAISSHWAHLAEITQHLLSASLGMVDQECLWAWLEKACHGEEVPIVSLLRTLHIENWLRNLSVHAILVGTDESSLNLSERLYATSDLS